MTRRLLRELQVCLNGKLVGYYSKLSHGGTTFQYDSAWLAWESAIALSRSMPLRKRAYDGEVVSSYFENLLPDSAVILRKIAERTGAAGRDAYSLLNEIGRDCVGALQFLPASVELPKLTAPTGHKVSDKDIEATLMNLERAPLGIEVEGGFRISLAGAQEKAAYLKINKTWYRPEGLSPTTHIFKPSIGKIQWESGLVNMNDSVDNEYYCMKLMKAFGLDIADVEIGTFGSQRVLIVERFDRIGLENKIILRLPQEDMCQASGYPPSQKYQNMGGPTLVSILKFLSASETPYGDQHTIFKCQILFWLIGAIDGHAKNFSIFLRPKNGFRLTPIYDVLSAQPAFDANEIRYKDYKLAMPLGNNKHYKIQSIHGRHFIETAVEAELSAGFAQEAIMVIQDAFEGAFEGVLKDLPKNFPMHIHHSIKTAAQKRLPRLDSAFD